MSLLRYRMTPTLSVTFKANALDDAVIVACKSTGIMGTLNMCSLPISLEYTHPLAQLNNCRSVLKATKDQNKKLRDIVDRQVLAGIVLSYLQNLKLLDKHTISSAVEKNTALQAAGPIVLEMAARFLNALSHSPYIEDHYNNKRRLPMFSIDWAYTASARSIGQSILQYIKTLQKATNPAELETARYLSIPMSLIKEAEDKDPVGSAFKRIKLSKNLRREQAALRDLKKIAKEYFADCEPLLATDLVQMCKLFINNMHLGVAETQAKILASKLRLTTFPDAISLAGIIEKSVARHLDDSMYSLSQDVSPRRIKTIAEILAEKKAAKEGIISEIDIRQEPKEEPEEDTPSTEDDLDEDVEDLLDFIEKVNSREEDILS